MQEPSVGAARGLAQTAYCVVSAIRCMNGIGITSGPRARTMTEPRSLYMAIPKRECIQDLDRLLHRDGHSLHA
jgi:hypothetical protein